jgi:uncharacterized membrane protein HdeD (DUF308 family)
LSQRKRERRIGPDWTQFGIGVVALLVAVERVAHPLWIARQSGWYEEFQPLIPPSETLTTPSQSLSSASLLLDAALVLIGLALLRSAFRGRRSPW